MAAAQRLVRKICPDCKGQYQPEGQMLQLLGVDEHTTAKFMHGEGCNYCFNTGFRGREGVFEILKADEDIRSAILADKNALAIKKTAVKKGMKTLLDSAILKVFEGQTSVEEVKRVIAPERF
jgi:type II secretory ATPase GspE/PulE/Tfp pilus assembly ATPase PilB-like protein